MNNPMQMVKSYISNNANPMLKNLINMANKGDAKGIETFARNLYKEKGRDFDQEFNQFMNNFK